MRTDASAWSTIARLLRQCDAVVFRWDAAAELRFLRFFYWALPWSLFIASRLVCWSIIGLAAYAVWIGLCWIVTLQLSAVLGGAGLAIAAVWLAYWLNLAGRTFTYFGLLKLDAYRLQEIQGSMDRLAMLSKAR